ncbi:MAG: dihydropteroate synthase, partial [Opitutales bacterium]
MAAPRQPWPGFTWGARSYLMGILNVTPDSFSDGGRCLEPTAALAQARQMAAEGADLLDIGAESTRPGAEPVSTDDEWARLESVLTALEADPDTPPVSLDTTKAPVAEKAFSGGLACVLNDVHGLLGDPALADVAAQYQVGVIVMHNARLRPASGDIVEAAKRYFDEALGVADRAGISGNALVLDPGIGFGLTPQQSLTLLQRIGEL